MTLLYLLWYYEVVKRLWYYFLYLLLFWGSFRYFVQLPEVIEELWFKPLIWLVPLFWWNLSLKSKIVFFSNKWKESLALGFGVALVYFLMLRSQSGRVFEINLDLIGVVLSIAIVEELTFSGFVFGYLEKLKKGSILNFLIVGLMVALIRLPILFFVYQASGREVFGVLLVAFSSGVVNAWIRQKTGSVAGSILARLGMNIASLG